MSRQFDNRNRIALWPNEFKEEGTRQPDLKGHGEFECEHCRQMTQLNASGWYRRDDASEKAPEVSRRRSGEVGRTAAAPEARERDDGPRRGIPWGL